MLASSASVACGVVVDWSRLVRESVLFFLLCLCSCLPFGVQILIIIIVIGQEKRTPALHQEQWTGVDRDLTATGSEDDIGDTWIRDLYRFGLGIVH